MSQISVANARLLGLCFQLLATGAYGVYLVQCITILRKKLREGVSVLFPLASGLIFLVTATAAVLNVVLAFQAFGVHGSDRPDPASVYADVASPVALAKNVLLVMLGVISDVIIVYRTFVIWNSSIIIIVLPVLLLLGDFALGVWSLWSLAQTKTGVVLINGHAAERVRDFFAITFSVNMLCAGLICWKIWRVTSSVPSYITSRRPTRHVLEVIIETAAIYCAHLLILIVTNSVHSNVFFMFLDPLPPVTALVFSMIIVRARARSHATTFLPTTIHFADRVAQIVGSPRSSEDPTAVNATPRHAVVELHLDTIIRDRTDGRVDLREEQKVDTKGTESDTHYTKSTCEGVGV